MPDEVTTESPTSSDELKLRICFIRLFWAKNSQPSSSRGRAKISNERAPLLFMSAQSFVSSSGQRAGAPRPVDRVGCRGNGDGARRSLRAPVPFVRPRRNGPAACAGHVLVALGAGRATTPGPASGVESRAAGLVDGQGGGPEG